MIKDIRDVKECPDCAGTELVYVDSRNQVICKDCGLVYEPLTPETEKVFEVTHAIETKEREIGKPILPAEPMITRAKKKPAKKKAKKKVKKKKVKKKVKKRPKAVRRPKKRVKRKAAKRPKKRAAKKPKRKPVKRKPVKKKRRFFLLSRFRRKRK